MTVHFCRNVRALQRMRHLQAIMLLTEDIPDRFLFLSSDHGLSVNERIVLNVLLCNAGEVVERERLMCALYSDEGSWPTSNTLQVFVNRLRKKLKGKVHIEAITRVGYRIYPTES